MYYIYMMYGCGVLLTWAVCLVMCRCRITWGIAFLSDLLRTDNIYNNSYIYQLNCLERPKKYISQTGRTFKTIYKEHIHAIRNNWRHTGYCQHILDAGHTYGNIESTMTIIRKARKGKFPKSLKNTTYS
jgi:hypothetical protein